MTDIQVAVGREQLKRLPGLLERRHKLAARYSTLLGQVHGVLVPEQPAWARTNWQSYCIYLPEGVGQREVMQAMLDAGVSTRRGIMCAHREPAYAREPWSCGSGEGRCACPGGSCERLRNSERAQERSIVLPLYDQLTESEQDRVVAASSEAVAAERRAAVRRS